MTKKIKNPLNYRTQYKDTRVLSKKLRFNISCFGEYEGD